MPTPVEPVIVPPDPLRFVVASPVTVNPPVPAAVPVLLRTMPLDAPFDEMLWNVRPDEPMSVLTTLRPTPLPELIVLPVPVAVTVPPPVALNAVVPLELVLSVSAPVKLML